MHKAGDHYFVNPDISPVVELECSTVSIKNVLSRGRLYFRAGYDGRDGWVEFPERVYTVFKSMVSYLKKNVLTRESLFGGYVSKGTKSFIADGGKVSQF